jgi:hypothetical protein
MRKPIVAAWLWIALASYGHAAPAAAAGTSNVAQADRSASAEQFVRQLYAGYVDTPNASPPSPFGTAENGIFDPSLLALLRRERETAGGEMGLMDFDPICACQDWEKLRVIHIDVTLKGTDDANAVVAFTNGGQREVVSYQLATVNRQWRVHDIGTKNMPSFRQYLVAGMAKRQKGTAR